MLAIRVSAEDQSMRDTCDVNGDLVHLGRGPFHRPDGHDPRAVADRRLDPPEHRAGELVHDGTIALAWLARG
jgi:hypothetical protein